MEGRWSNDGGGSKRQGEVVEGEKVLCRGVRTRELKVVKKKDQSGFVKRKTKYRFTVRLSRTESLFGSSRRRVRGRRE